MQWQTRITRDPEVLGGKPVIKGTRISVELIVGWRANGWDIEQILKAYPTLSQEDIEAALEYSRNQEPADAE
ncbi:MAG: DUF433 domain-containing protein [Pseudomonadota bacterium]